MGRVLDLGKIMITLHGRWSEEVQYEFLSVAFHLGNGYIALRDTLGEAPDEYEDDAWMCIVKSSIDNNYEILDNKPKINGTTLSGNLTPEQLSLISQEVLTEVIGAEVRRATEKENEIGRALSEEVQRATAKEAEIVAKAVHPYTSLERVCAYLYCVTFDELPPDNGGSNPITGGCSSYVKDGKLFTNFDWKYDRTAHFVVKTKDFEGQSFISGMNDGELDDEKIAQLPYRIHRGENQCGIAIATHVVYNDWGWTGTGKRNRNLIRLPYLILSQVQSRVNLLSTLRDIANNLYCPQELAETGYLLQFIILNGSQTLALIPPTVEGQSYEIVDISDCPKMTNFRYVGRAQVSRTDEDIQLHPTGIERYNMMPCPLRDLRFSLGYGEPRLSEFIGINSTDKYSTDAQLRNIWTSLLPRYRFKTRNGEFWQTVESAVYGSKLESLIVQENWGDVVVGSQGNKTIILDYSEGQITDWTLSGIDGEGKDGYTAEDIFKKAFDPNTHIVLRGAGGSLVEIGRRLPSTVGARLINLYALHLSTTEIGVLHVKLTNEVIEDTVDYYPQGE